MLHFSSFCLDDANRCIWRTAEDGANHRLTITPRAFDILQYLIDHAGQLVTHEALLSALWPGVYVQPEVLKTHMLSIRTALGDDPRCPSFIETQRGRGYRFIAPLRVAGRVGMSRDREHEYDAFIDRTSQQRRLNDLCQEACRGSTQIVFVSGESGIGKTELVTQFLKSHADDPAISTSFGQCIETFGETENYYPVMEALTQLLRGSGGGLIARTLTSVAPTWAFHLFGSIPEAYRRGISQQIDATAHNRMLRELCAFFQEVTAQRPLVMVLENLHWADYCTIDLLSALARQSGAARVLIVATYCLEEALLARHPLPQLNMDLRLRGLCQDIVLAPLSESAIFEFLSDHRDSESGDTIAETARFLHDRTGGNPLLMSATLNQLARIGMVQPTSCGWTLDRRVPGMHLEIPQTLGFVLDHRIKRLSEIQQHVLEVASVAGATFCARTLAAAADMSCLAFEDACETLCAQQSVIQPVPQTKVDRMGNRRSYAFRHGIYRQALYERQGALHIEHLISRILESRNEASTNIFDEIAPSLAVRSPPLHHAWPS